MPRNFALIMARIPPQLMLLIMLLLAACAAGVFQMQSEERNKDIKALKDKANMPKETASMLVAAKDISEGELMRPEALSLQEVEKDRLPIGALTSVNAALGLKARQSISKGEAVMSQFLALNEAPRGFEAKIKPGYRAITFPVDAATGVAGFIGPDSRVDILLQSGSGASADTQPILSDVQVIAVGQTYQKKEGESEAQATNNVTVALKPKEGQKLISAMAVGKLYCLMRSQADRTPISLKDINSVLKKNETVTDNDSSLSSLPPLRPAVSPAVPSPAIPTGSAGAKLHSVDNWSANQKNEQLFEGH